MTKTAKTKVRSLSQIDPALAADKGFEFEIKDVSGAKADVLGRFDYAKLPGVGMFITVTGKEGSAFQALARKEFDRQMARRGADKSQDEPETSEKMISRAIDECVACTKGWRGVVIDEKEGELPFNEANARRLYALKFVRIQTLQMIEDSANFTGG